MRTEYCPYCVACDLDEGDLVVTSNGNDTLNPRWVRLDHPFGGESISGALCDECAKALDVLKLQPIHYDGPEWLVRPAGVERYEFPANNYAIVSTKVLGWGEYDRIVQDENGSHYLAREVT
jgi:hypothetical protein